MPRVSIIESKSTKEQFQVRFRVYDGGAYFYHQSDIIVCPSQIAPFNRDGSIKPRTRNYDRELQKQLQREMAITLQAYEEELSRRGRVTSESLALAIEEVKHPKRRMESKPSDMTIIERFNLFADDAERFGIISESRRKAYDLVQKQLSDYLHRHRRTTISAAEFGVSDLAAFRDYLLNICKLSPNTCVTRLKVLQAFYNELEDTMEVSKSPFRAISRNKKRAMMKTKYDEPIYLLSSEYQAIKEVELPKSLTEARDILMLLCLTGCRIGDFSRLTMDNVSVNEQGVPFLHYLPEKTQRSQSTNEEIETPLMASALELIKRTQFDFKLTHYVQGGYGLNKKIQKVIKAAGILRKVKVYNDKTQRNEYIQLYEVASSKIGRKTAVDILSKCQIDLYAAHLHRQGSEAVNRYTYTTLKDRQTLMCAAYNEQPIKVDNNLNLIS